MNLQLRFLITLSLLTASAANAQKLPNVQNLSVRAPQTIKIDGKLTEWDDSFKAHNSATDISYIMAKDDENLYLVVQAKDLTTINRVLGKGLTFNIQKSGKKNTRDCMSFTYPGFEKRQTIIFSFGSKKGVKPDTSAEAQAALVYNANRQIQNTAKNIRVTGVAGIDTMLSVYNETGIKAQGAINSEKFYSMEMALPLKYLNISAQNGDKFAYQIVVNGEVAVDAAVMGFLPTPAGEQMHQRAVAAQAIKIAPTDFWGEYTLAKGR